LAQGPEQTVNKIDLVPIASAFWTANIVGSQVMNETHEVLGTVDDLILTPNDIVPYGSLQGLDKHLVLPGATKDSLNALPRFEYAIRTVDQSSEAMRDPAGDLASPRFAVGRWNRARWLSHPG
jgi:hypothetical protein